MTSGKIRRLPRWIGLLLLGGLCSVPPASGGEETMDETEGQPPYKLLAVNPGPEDLAVYHRDGEDRLIVSWARRPYSRQCGGFLSLPLPLPEGEAKGEWDMVIEGTKTAAFKPVGISLLTEPAGDVWLFAAVGPCRHEQSPCCPEVRRFRLDGDMKLVAEKIFPRHEDLVAPNGIVAISREEFYVSNYLAGKSLLHYEKGVWENVKETQKLGLAAPNGLAWDAERGHLYVADFNAEKILRFRRNETGLLSDDGEVDLGGLGHPDNLVLDDEVGLLVATHRSKVCSGLHLFLGLPAPWDVYRIDPERFGEPPEHLLGSNDLCSDDRARVRAASVAVRSGETLIVGQLRRSHLLATVAFDPDGGVGGRRPVCRSSTLE